ncbi:hypothetical protein [Streptomyces werraensis]|uniref:hypothetical protein n=1 Tax=Streptomyces werraensis TaxID=68284 RepID=UPI00382F9E7D
MRIVEGFHRVEWISHLAADALDAVLNDPAWARSRLREHLIWVVDVLGCLCDRWR